MKEHPSVLNIHENYIDCLLELTSYGDCLSILTKYDGLTTIFPSSIDFLDSFKLFQTSRCRSQQQFVIHQRYLSLVKLPTS